jgi:ribonuclease HII
MLTSNKLSVSPILFGLRKEVISVKIAEIKALLSKGPTTAEMEELVKDERTGVKNLLKAYYKKQIALQEEHDRLEKLQFYEQKAYAKGAHYIAGIDEVGRGPLAGPLVMAAVILPPHCYLPHLNDSKKLSPSRREELYPQILDAALEAVVTIVCPGVIDALNIYQATKRGMEETLQALTLHPEVALVDAMEPKVPGMEVIPIIHGDALSASISAASVVAKVYRDALMVELDKLFPQYGFAENKGYGSQKHMDAIAKVGATIWHRRSFEPVRSMKLGPLPCQADKIVVVKKPVKKV